MSRPVPEPLPIGSKWGKLTVTSEELVKSHWYHQHFRCDCGKDVVFSISHVRRGAFVSCGCQRRAALHRMNLPKPVAQKPRPKLAPFMTDKALLPTKPPVRS